MTKQEAEIDQLRRVTSSEVSSSAEATPESSFVFHPPQGPFSAQRSPIYKSPVALKHEDTPVRKYYEAPVMLLV